MKSKSWGILATCAVLLGFLTFLYAQSKQVPLEMNQSRLASMLDTMKDAVAHKNTRLLMSFVDQSPDTRISNLNLDQLRLLLSRTFNTSDQLEAVYTGLEVRTDGDDALADFDLKILHHMSGATGDDYSGHIKLQIKRVEVPHLLGLYHTREWKITRAESSGPDLSNYGDY